MQDRSGIIERFGDYSLVADPEPDMRSAHIAAIRKLIVMYTQDVYYDDRVQCVRSPAVQGLCSEHSESAGSTSGTHINAAIYTVSQRLYPS